MTIITNYYTMDNKDGVDLNNVVATVNASTPEYPGLNAKLGDQVQGNGGSVWLYVQASTTVTALNVVAIDSDFKANNITASIVASNRYTYGIALFNTTLAEAGQTFWACLKVAGGARINFASTAAAGAKVYVSGTAGMLTTGATTTIPQMVGVAFTTTISGATTANEATLLSFMVPYVSV